MYHGYNFIDSNAHILEPADLFERYLEAPFRSEMSRAWVDSGPAARLWHFGDHPCGPRRPGLCYAVWMTPASNRSLR